MIGVLLGHRPNLTRLGPQNPNHVYLDNYTLKPCLTNSVHTSINLKILNLRCSCNVNLIW